MSMLFASPQVNVPSPSLLYIPSEPIQCPFYLRRYCEFCQSEQEFVCGRICEGGHVGACVRCGDEVRVPFRRMMSEVCA